MNHGRATSCELFQSVSVRIFKRNTFQSRLNFYACWANGIALKSATAAQTTIPESRPQKRTTTVEQPQQQSK